MKLGLWVFRFLTAISLYSAVQNKFWQMHDFLYEHQQAPEDKHLDKYADKLGLDISRFNIDISTRVHRGRIREDFLSGVYSGVNGTPTFYINGMHYNDSWDLETLLQTLRFAVKNVNKNQS